MKKKLEIMIVNGLALTMEGTGVGPVENCGIGISGNRIEVVGDTNEVINKYQANRIIDAKNKLIMPGLIDAHIHTGIGLLRGVAQDINNWMLEGMWPFESKIRLDIDAIKIGSMMNIIEALKAGTTTFCDFDTPMDQIVLNHHEIGTRLVAAELISAIPSDTSNMIAGEIFPLITEIEQIKLQRNLDLIDKWHGQGDGRITCMLGPQASNMVTKSTLLEIKEISRKTGIGIHMHVSQSIQENDHILAMYGKRAIPFLDDLGYLDENLVAIHLTAATKEEIQLLGRSGAGMVVCSSGNALISGNVPPIIDFLKVSKRVALGSDEAPGNGCCNMFNEMKLTALLNKCKYSSPTILPAWELIRMVTINAAKTIGLGDQIGSIKQGKKADLIIIDLMQPTMGPVITYPVRNIVPNLVYSARGHEVETVIIDGKIIVENYKLATANEKQIMIDAVNAAQRVSNKAAPEFFARNNLLNQMMKENKL